MQTLNKLNYSSKPYKYLTYIVSIYSFSFLLPSMLLRKMILVPVLGVVPIADFFSGIYFLLLDIVTEVYGYYEARKVLMAGLLTYTIFVFLMEFITNIPSPKNYFVAWSSVQDSNAYIYIFSNLYLVWFSVVFCAFTANTINMIILSKWKILVKGKFFWFRSIITSLISALIFSSISNLFAIGIFLHKSQILYYLEIVSISLFSKLITLTVFAYPSALLCYFLKQKEGIDTYDYNINYSPFYFKK